MKNFLKEMWHDMPNDLGLNIVGKVFFFLMLSMLLLIVVSFGSLVWIVSSLLEFVFRKKVSVL